MDDLYSPYTGEYIAPTSSPADWMLHAGTPRPEHDPSMQSPFWRGDYWELVKAVPPEVPVPQVVSRFQALAALMNAGLLDAVESAMTAVDADPMVKLAWNTIQEFHRDSPMLAAIAGKLNLSDSQVDDLFRAAALIKA